MGNKIEVSVVIPFFNHGVFIDETLQSLFDQTFQNFEILIVDDFSTEKKSVKKLEEIKQKYPKINVYHNTKNAGPAFSRNFGVQKANGAFVLPIDSDDKIEQTFLEKALFFLKKEDETHFVYSFIQHFDGDSSLYKTMNPYNFYEELFENKLCICSLIRKKSWEKVGGYNELLHENESEDWDFWLKMGKNGFHGKCIPEPLFLYRKSQNLRLKKVINNYDKIVKNLRKRHKELYGFWSLRKLKKFWDSENRKQSDQKFLSKTFVKLPRFLQTIAIKFFEAELLEKENWKKSPIKCFQLMIPIVFRSKINQRISFFSNNTKFSEFYQEEAPKKILRMKKKSLKISTLKKKNIAFFLPWIPLGGVEMLTLQIFKLLQKKFNFILFTTKTNKNIMHSEFSQYAAIYHLPNLFDKEEKEEKIKFIEEKLKELNIKTIFISNSYFAFKILPELKFKIPDLRVIVSLHGYDETWDFLRISSLFDPFIDKFICVSETLKGRLKKLLKPTSILKIEVIHNAIPSRENNETEDVVNLKRKKGQKNILFLGRYDWDKNPHLILDIADYVANDLGVDCFKFFLFGDGILKQELKTRAQKINTKAKRKVVMVGNKVNNLERIFEHVDVTINTSSREGFGLSMIESLFYKVPVCGFNLPVFQEILPPKYSFLVEQKGKQQVERFTKELFEATSANFSEKEKEAMQKFVLKNFSETEFVKKYKNLMA